jgi:hypothetical protein
VFTVFTETAATLETVVAGMNFGEMVQVVPTRIELPQPVLDTVYAPFPVAPRKVEARATGWLPRFVTVNTHDPLLGVPATPAVRFPMLSPLLIMVLAQIG